MKKIQVIGRRGVKGLGPENILISFKRAMEIGCDALELDVHLTKDGDIAVIHDDVLDLNYRFLSLLSLLKFRPQLCHLTKKIGVGLHNNQ